MPKVPARRKKEFDQLMRSVKITKEYWLPKVKDGAFVAVSFKTKYTEQTKYFGVKKIKKSWKVVGYVKMESGY